MKSFEAKPSVQEGSKIGKETIDPDKKYSDTRVAEEASKLQKLAAEGKIADELEANRLRELILAGKTAEIGALMNSSIGSQEKQAIYTQGNVEQPKFSGNAGDLPKNNEIYSDVIANNIGKSIEKTLEDSSSEENQPLNPDEF